MLSVISVGCCTLAGRVCLRLFHYQVLEKELEELQSASYRNVRLQIELVSAVEKEKKSRSLTHISCDLRLKIV